MNIQIIHKDTKTIKTVRELDDLLFDEGWRFYNYVKPNNTNLQELDNTMREININRESGYTHSLNKNTF